MEHNGKATNFSGTTFGKVESLDIGFQHLIAFWGASERGRKALRKYTCVEGFKRMRLLLFKSLFTDVKTYCRNETLLNLIKNLWKAARLLFRY